MLVPGASPQSRTFSTRPPLTRISVPVSAPGSRVARRKRETLAMLGSASPRKPSVAMAARSAPVRSLLVACRSRQSRASSRSMPCPSSTTRTSAMPPRWMTISTTVARASRLFSTSSLTTEAGRSTTSPAATWLATISDNSATRLMEKSGGGNRRKQRRLDGPIWF